MHRAEPADPRVEPEAVVVVEHPLQAIGDASLHDVLQGGAAAEPALPRLLSS